MAMIQCPKCGEMLSDKAQKCVHCGYELVKEQMLTCKECGAELEANATICTKCGCPVEESCGGTTNKKPTKKIIIVIVCVLIAIACAVVGAKKVQADKAAKAAEEAKAYGSSIKSTAGLIIEGAADAETCGNLIEQVWNNSIYEESDSTTDKYTRKNGTGVFYDDFNDALTNLFSDSDFQSDISAIVSNQDEVESAMKELKQKDTPDEWADAYDELEDLYDAYLDMTNLVTSPTGSLTTFSSDFAEDDEDVVKYYQKVMLNFN